MATLPRVGVDVAGACVVELATETLGAVVVAGVALRSAGLVVTFAMGFATASTAVCCTATFSVGFAKGFTDTFAMGFAADFEASVGVTSWPFPFAVTFAEAVAAWLAAALSQGFIARCAASLPGTAVEAGVVVATRCCPVAEVVRGTNVVVGTVISWAVVVVVILFGAVVVATVDTAVIGEIFATVTTLAIDFVVVA